MNTRKKTLRVVVGVVSGVGIALGVVSQAIGSSDCYIPRTTSTASLVQKFQSVALRCNSSGTQTVLAFSQGVSNGVQVCLDGFIGSFGEASVFGYNANGALISGCSAFDTTNNSICVINTASCAGITFKDLDVFVQ